jgi:hypothetical protein
MICDCECYTLTTGLTGGEESNMPFLVESFGLRPVGLGKWGLFSYESMDFCHLHVQELFFSHCAFSRHSCSTYPFTIDNAHTRLLFPCHKPRSTSPHYSRWYMFHINQLHRHRLEAVDLVQPFCSIAALCKLLHGRGNSVSSHGRWRMFGVRALAGESVCW